MGGPRPGRQWELIWDDGRRRDPWPWYGLQDYARWSTDQGVQFLLAKQLSGRRRSLRGPCPGHRWWGPIGAAIRVRGDGCRRGGKMNQSRRWGRFVPLLVVLVSGLSLSSSRAQTDRQVVWCVPNPFPPLNQTMPSRSFVVWVGQSNVLTVPDRVLGGRRYRDGHQRAPQLQRVTGLLQFHDRY